MILLCTMIQGATQHDETSHLQGFMLLSEIRLLVAKMHIISHAYISHKIVDTYSCGLCSCSVNLSLLKEDDVHDLTLNIIARGSGDTDGGAEDGGEQRGTIHCLLQICSTNVEEENPLKPVDMNVISRRYVS